MMKSRAEAYNEFQGQDISRLRHELNHANEELQSNDVGIEKSFDEREVERMN